PRIAKVARAVNMRAQVVETKTVDGGVGSAGVEMRSLDNGNLAPGLELGWRDVLPGLSGVLRNVNQPVVGAGPNCIRVLEGRRHGVNHATVFALLRIVSCEDAEVWRSVVGSAGEIGAHRFPGISAVCGFEQDVGREIERSRINRRK